MMRSSRLLILPVLASFGFITQALAQNASALPSIEVNQDVLKALGGDTTPPAQQGTTVQSGNAPATAPYVPAEGTRTTTITPGEPRLVWVKGPEGQQVEMKPDPKPRKKKVKKPAVKPVEAPAEPAAPKVVEPVAPKVDEKAAPVAPVDVEEKKPEPVAAVPVPPVAAPAAPVPPTPAAPVPPPPPPAAPAPAPAAPVLPAPPAPVPPAPPAAMVPPAPVPAAAAPATPPVPPAAIPAPPPPPAAAVPAQPQPVATAPAAAPAPAAAAPAMAKGTPELSMTFKATEATLPLTMKESMDKVVAKLKANEAQRMNIVAYASAAADQASTARRVSLARALSVRAYLIDNGINNLRINVQAEGDKNPGGAADRVDLFITDK